MSRDIDQDSVAKSNIEREPRVTKRSPRSRTRRTASALNSLGYFFLFRFFFGIQGTLQSEDNLLAGCPLI